MCHDEGLKLILFAGSVILCSIRYPYNISLIMDPHDTQDQKMQDQKVYPAEGQQKQKVEPSVVPEADKPTSTPTQRLKDMVRQAKIGEQDEDLDKVEPSELKFPLKKAKNNFCSRFFTGGTEQYYVCNDCSFKTGGYSTMCYCTSCWQAERHAGHNFYSQIPYSNGAYCDCGRIERFKEDSFCQNHAQYSAELPCQIPEADRKEFLDCMTQLMELAISKDNNGLFQKIQSYLEDLNEGSIHYNRLTFQLFTRKTLSQQKFKNQTYFQVLKNSVNYFNRLMLHVGGDLRSRLDLIKFLCSFSKEGEFNEYTNEVLQTLGSSSVRELINLTAVEKLMDEGFYHEIMYQTIRNENSAKFKPEVYARLLLNKVKSAKNLGQVCKMDASEISPQVAEIILLRIAQEYPSSETIKKYISGDSDKSNPWGAIQLVDSKEEVHKNLPNDVKQANKMLFNVLSILLATRLHKFTDFRAYLISLGIAEPKLEEILYWLVGSVRNAIEDGESEQTPAVAVAFLLFAQSPSASSLIQRAWKILLQSEKEDQTEIDIQKKVDMVYLIVGVLFRIDIFLRILAKKNIKTFNLPNTETIDEQKEEQFMNEWFRSFLYERKAVSRSEIVKMKSEGLLEFKNCSKILNELCSYNEQQQIFNFCNSKVYKNLLSEFPMFPQLGNFQGIYTNSFTFGDELKLNPDSISSYLIEKVLDWESIVVALDASWKKAKAHEGFAENAEKYGYLYLFALVLIDSLTKGKDKELRQRLEKLRESEEALSEYTANEDEREKLKKLLRMNKTEQVEDKEQKEESNKVNKKLSDEKKKKMAEKYKKKREVILERVRSLGDGKASEEEELCILCHEREKANNELVYLSSVSKNSTICGAFYGKDSISNTYISTCFHAVHIKCFVEYQKTSSISFNCPLCQAASNCIIPATTKENQKLNKICRNSLVAHMVTNLHIYDIQSDLMLLFKHLVESKGLNTLMESTRYENKKKVWMRNDEFMSGLMLSIYTSATEEARKQYINTIDAFITEIEACERLECKLAQLAVAEALKDVLLGTTESEEAVKNTLLKVRATIKEDEFATLHEQICRLTETEIELPPLTKEEEDKEKVTLSFSLVKLNPEAEEEIKKHAGKNCELCSTEPCAYVCLICKALACENCRGTHASNQHNDVAIFLVTSQLKLECARQGYYQNEDVYENEFRIAFSEKNDYDEMNDIKDYHLNETRMGKILAKFLEN